MTALAVRRLLIDMQPPFPGRWNGGDAFRSAFFNALSMSFPVGEQYFIDSVRNGLKALPEAERERFAPEVQGFIGQEATHRRIHALLNGHLGALGYRNEVERRAVKRLAANAHRDVRVHVAATAATEHFTAIFAGWILRHPEALAGAEPRLRTLWLWHCAEESEHRNTAVDLYTAISSHHGWRVRVFRHVTLTFLTDVMRQTVRNLWHDRQPVPVAHLAQRRDAAVRARRPGARQHRPVARLPRARFPPEPARRRSGATMAARQRGAVHGRRRRALKH